MLGSNQYGQLNVPKGMKNIKWLASSGNAYFTCAVHDAGFSCWGDLRTIKDQHLPNIKLVGIGGSHLCRFARWREVFGETTLRLK